MADATTIGRVNAALANGGLRFANGELVADRLEGGLVREDRQVLYPIVRGIPLLTVDRAIRLDEFAAEV